MKTEIMFIIILMVAINLFGFLLVANHNHIWDIPEIITFSMFISSMVLIILVGLIEESLKK